MKPAIVIYVLLLKKNLMITQVLRIYISWYKQDLLKLSENVDLDVVVSGNAEVYCGYSYCHISPICLMLHLSKTYCSFYCFVITQVFVYAFHIFSEFALSINCTAFFMD